MQRPTGPGPAISFNTGTRCTSKCQASAHTIGEHREPGQHQGSQNQAASGLDKFRTTSVTRSDSHCFVLSSGVAFSGLKLPH